MSVIKEFSVRDIVDKFEKMRKPRPNFPPGLEKVTVEIFTLQDGSSLFCCEYFRMTVKPEQDPDVKVYRRTIIDRDVCMDQDEEDVVIIVPDKSQSASQKRYKIKKKTIFFYVPHTQKCIF